MNKVNPKGAICAAALIVGITVAIVDFRPARITVAHAQETCAAVPKPLVVYGFAVEGFNDRGQQGSFRDQLFLPAFFGRDFHVCPEQGGSSLGHCVETSLSEFWRRRRFTPDRRQRAVFAEPGLHIFSNVRGCGRGVETRARERGHAVRFFC